MIMTAAAVGSEGALPGTTEYWPAALSSLDRNQPDSAILEILALAKSEAEKEAEFLALAEEAEILALAKSDAGLPVKSLIKCPGGLPVLQVVIHELPLNLPDLSRLARSCIDLRRTCIEDGVLPGPA